MNPIQYFQSQKDYFWQWEEFGRVVSIPDSFTIGYREFLMDLLEMMAPQGLPPFGSLLLAVAATNSNAKEGIDAIVALMNEKEYNNHGDFDKVVKLLGNLANLPPEYKTSTNRKLLFQRLFQDCHNRMAIKESKEISQAFGINEIAPAFQQQEFNARFAKRDLKTLSVLSDFFPTPKSILERISGISESTDLALEIEADPIVDSTPPDFIDELIENDATFRVGALVKRIWSGLDIPFHNNLPSDQPIGGIADLTNKGDYDKLLLSEFANDDLMLMSRLANNEALYYHREVPPAKNNLERIVLIDTTLKNWGTIKTLAWASLLAIDNHPKNEITCKAFVIGNAYQEVAFQTVHNVVIGQQLLDASIDAASGLKLFFKENDLSNKELFLIIAAETLSRPSMGRCFGEYGHLINFWLHPAADGSLSLYKKEHSAKKFVQTIKLPLEELWKSKRKKRKEKFNEKYDYPILFPSPIHVNKTFCAEDLSVYKITRKRDLLMWSEKDLKYRGRSGWEMIYEDFPCYGQHYAIGIDENGDRIVLVYNHQERLVTLVNATTKDSIQVSFDPPDYYSCKGFVYAENHFYYVTNKWYIKFDGTEGKEKVHNQHRVHHRLMERITHSEQLGNKFNLRFQIFKNIKRVFINELGDLVLNIHRLHFNAYHIFRLEKTDNIRTKLWAKMEGENHFIFNDGSEVMVEKSGMIILKSSNAEIPTIYMPSLMDTNLAAATSTSFSGSPYYLKQDALDVIVNFPINNKLTAIKIVKNVLGIGLKEAKEMIDNTPGKIAKGIKKMLALDLKAQLGGDKVDVSLSIPNGPQQIMEPRLFNSNYFLKFIQHIQRHATED